MTKEGKMLVYSLFVWLRNGATRVYWVDDERTIWTPSSSDGRLRWYMNGDEHPGQFLTFPIAMSSPGTVAANLQAIYDQDSLSVYSCLRIGEGIVQSALAYLDDRAVEEYADEAGEIAADILKGLNKRLRREANAAIPPRGSLRTACLCRG